MSNAILVPSGDHAGLKAQLGVDVTRLTPDPSVFMAKMS
jgi:hypothetical protein